MYLIQLSGTGKSEFQISTCPQCLFVGSGQYLEANAIATVITLSLRTLHGRRVFGFCLNMNFRSGTIYVILTLSVKPIWYRGIILIFGLVWAIFLSSLRNFYQNDHMTRVIWSFFVKVPPFRIRDCETMQLVINTPGTFITQKDECFRLKQKYKAFDISPLMALTCRDWML